MATSYLRKAVSIVSLIAFIITQCGLGLAAPAPQNLRTQNIERPQEGGQKDARATGLENALQLASAEGAAGGLNSLKEAGKKLLSQSHKLFNTRSLWQQGM